MCVAKKELSLKVDSFLGAGSYGRVFDCGDGTALKVAVGLDSVRHLVAEGERTKKRESGEKDEDIYVVRKVEAAVEVEEDSIAFVQLQPVGNPNVEKLKKNLMSAIDSLCKMHKAGQFHGDARWSNLVLKSDGSGCFWVDLGKLQVSAVDDWRTFCCSWMGWERSRVFPEDLTKIIDGMVATSNSTGSSSKFSWSSASSADSLVNWLWGRESVSK